MLRMFNTSLVASKLMWVIFTGMLAPTLYMVHCNSTLLLEWNLFSISSTPMMMTIILDPLGLMFSCTVVMISANILKFSTIYMKEDKFINRFTVLVLLFVLSMNMLIFFPHLIILLLGWDGLGIVSFILVIYYQNPKSLAAGMITALTNRIGDVMLLLAIAWTLNQGHWNILHMWAVDENMYQALVIIIAAMTKSAQMPFSSWLPAAMAAPTPVSALVHSSTLVTAGVFLLIRFYNFLSSVWWFTTFLLFVAVSTTLMAGLSASSECDMKKIIALSTLSQLGMMMAAMGLGMAHMAFFHMVTHAMFKALLFVCAGSFIHSHMHSQDLRWMGNLTKQMPTTTSCLIMANLALCGFPFMSGFYSKDMIVEASLYYPHNSLMINLILFAVGLTAFYSTRFTMCVVLSPNNCGPYMHLEESNSLTSPMLLLASMSVISGSALTWILPLKQEMMMIPLDQKLKTLMLVTLGALMSWFFLTTTNMTKTCLYIRHPIINYFSCTMWFLVPLSSQFMMKLPMYVSHNYLKLTDQSWLELLGGQGINNVSSKASNIYLASLKSTPMNYLMMSSMLLLVATLVAI
uniref:NADH-ubiquinone oxidoreductase chain 5 n=1 Tax=Lumbricus terrestris TaxID=6398 RepID=NU5M_LUMTE|nr:NADH dehydrogenase subunit 5 [Lumbricus terrestris]Q34947.1 RecName: Full=NADH-ubiquinone oxidoreductase chain 5; AltName: Full=NADH dehydrogenase subunit 5 [Lumbricus terrestris]AAC46871.1 NADH dehydrogenase subunit 5 [Lumbricus terrestris]prf//2122275H NADH dehydrogenase:SUBUNIT=5 [Lumbricus terrestris]